jgi:hypothetical protein
MSMKNSNDTVGNRTDDLPDCSAVPQPTAPPRAKFLFCVTIIQTIYIHVGKYVRIQVRTQSFSLADSDAIYIYILRLILKIML